MREDTCLMGCLRTLVWFVYIAIVLVIAVVLLFVFLCAGYLAAVRIIAAKDDTTAISLGAAAILGALAALSIQLSDSESHKWRKGTYGIAGRAYMLSMLMLICSALVRASLVDMLGASPSAELVMARPLASFMLGCSAVGVVLSLIGSLCATLAVLLVMVDDFCPLD
jgi:hypothetical protein